jgi:RNA-directed DNA polymerase
MYSLSGGRRPARQRASSDPTPMNQPNKERQLSAEAGEGRAQTEENTVQSHMRPTQSGKSMSQGLHGVRHATFAATHPW